MTLYEQFKALDDTRAKIELAKMLTKAYTNGMLVGTICSDDPDMTAIEIQAEVDEFKENGMLDAIMKSDDVLKVCKMYLDALNAEVKDA